MKRGKSPTGRLTSNQPAIQNIPIRTEEGRKIRKAFMTQNPMQGSQALNPKPVIWLGSDICDICKQACGAVLFDAALTSGRWATMCEKDFDRLGGKLGVGKGQMYRANYTTGNYEKVGG